MRNALHLILFNISPLTSPPPSTGRGRGWVFSPLTSPLPPQGGAGGGSPLLLLQRNTRLHALGTFQQRGNGLEVIVAGVGTKRLEHVQQFGGIDG